MVVVAGKIETHRWWSRMLMVIVAGASLVLLSGCGGSDDEPSEAAEVDATDAADDVATETESTTTSTTTSLPENAVSIDGLQLSAVSFGAGGVVSVANTSTAEISLEGMQVCNGDSCAALSGSVAAGGQTAVPGADLGGLEATGGEAILFAGDDTSDAAGVVSYVAWGTGGPTDALAAEAGLWPEGATVAAVGDSISLGGFPGDPESWG